MADIKFKSTLETLLKTDERIVDEHKELNLSVIRGLIDKLDEGLIQLLLNNKEAKERFFLKLPNQNSVGKDVLVFKHNDFKFFMDENKIDNSYTAYENKIGLNTGGKYIKDEINDVVLNFPFKDCVLEGGQSTEEGIDEHYQYNLEKETYELKATQRREIFFNEVLALDEIDRLEESKAFTNIKKYTTEGAEKINKFDRNKDGLITDNLIIKGNNLLALHCLKEQFSGQVKLIYIDPPYNTEGDSFKYNDTFAHSTWLTFIKNRLEIAKELLSVDGLIFVQINDIEQAYLKLLMDGVFGRDCYETTICVKMSHLSGVKMNHKTKKIPKVKESILMYSKTPNSVKLNPQFTSVSWDDAFNRYTSFIDKNSNSEDCSNWKPISLLQALKKNNIDLDNKEEVLDFKLKNADIIYQTALNRSKDYPKEPKNKFIVIDNKFILNGRELIFASEKIIERNGKKQPVSIISDIWTDIGINNVFQEGGKEISLRFGKKPEMLLERIIALASKEGDLVMDFFVGTGTTCAVSHKMNRRYIGIEQLDYIKDLPTARLLNVINNDNSGISGSVDWNGGGSFVYLELKKWNEEAKEKIADCKSLKELEKLLNELSERYFLNYNVNLKEFQDKIINEKEFIALPLPKQKEMFVKMLDLNQLYVNTSEMEDIKFGLSEEDVALTKNFYSME